MNRSGIATCLLFATTYATVGSAAQNDPSQDLTGVASLEGTWLGGVMRHNDYVSVELDIRRLHGQVAATVSFPNSGSEKRSVESAVKLPELVLTDRNDDGTVRINLTGTVSDGFFRGSATSPRSNEGSPFEFVRVLDVATERLAALKGEFDLESGKRCFVRSVQIAGNTVLTLSLDQGAPRRLFPISDTRFVVGADEKALFPETGMLEFQFDAQEHPDGIVLRHDDQVTKGRAIGVDQSPGAPDSTGGGWKMTRMNLDLHLLPEGKRMRMTGSADLQLDIQSSLGPSLGVNGELMKFTEIDATGAATREINRPHTIDQHARVANLRFAQPFERGSTLHVTFALETVGRGFQFVISRRLALASWTNRWFPIVLPPAGEEPDATLARCVGRTSFRLPKNWRSVSNGQLVERREEGDESVDVWQADTPVAWSFAAGPYSVGEHVVDRRTVRVYRLSAEQSESKTQAVMLAKALAAMEKHFGPYPYASYAIAEVPNGLVQWYASSEQGFIMATADAFAAPGGNLPLFAHEMAHGWWGNLVTTSGPGAILCSESLAQYSAVLAIEELEGTEAATDFLRFSRTGYSSLQCAKGYFSLQRDGKDRALSHLDSGGWQHNLSDAKGHWVYHMLRGRVGDQVFFDTLRSLIDRYSDRAMSLDDIRAAFIQAAPDKGLEQFFSQWLDRRGAPVLDVMWKPSGSKEVSVTITQSQASEPYHLMVELGVQTADAMKIETVEIEKRETTVRLPVQGTVTGVKIDPNHRLLIWTEDYGPRPVN